ncbi:Dedicator of cytokinesis protein 9-like protein, partial [Dinothrombium tinctorium]
VRPTICEPVDYESFVLKYRTFIQQDGQRELILFPMDDFEAKQIPRQLRTTKSVPSQCLPPSDNNLSIPLYVRECIDGFTRDWTVVSFKYEPYSGSWQELPKTQKRDLADHVYEIDDDDELELEDEVTSDYVAKEGYILKGAESGTNSFISVAAKLFKRRWMILRQRIDGSSVLELYKDNKRSEAKGEICLDFCHQVTRNSRRGKYAFELRMKEEEKQFSHILAAENDEELESWLELLTKSIQCKSENSSRKSVALSETDSMSTPPMTPKFSGTLKGLETSKNPELMKYAKETDYIIAQQRKENRVNVFSVFPDLQSRRGLFITLKHVLDPKVSPFKEDFGFRFSFSCDSIEFNLKTTIDGNTCHVEPFFTSIAIYDAKKGKITEEFRFDINDKLVKHMLPQNVVNGEAVNEKEYTNEWIMDPKTAIFSVHSPNTDMFLVLRIEKVLSGGISSTSDAYLKSSENGIGKVGIKMHKSAKVTCQRMGTQYRMPFAWAAKQIFKTNHILDTSSDFGPIYRHDSNKLSDDDLIKHLNDLKTLEKLRNVTVIPGKVIVTIKKVTDNKLLSSAVTSSHLAIVPFDKPSQPACIEVQEFLLNEPRLVYPFTTFVNLLYVFPKCLKFDGQRIFPKARNICCVIEFRDSDEENATPLKLIFGRPGCDNQEFVTRVSTAISHHNTNPDFYEEVKIMLPTVLHDKQHLLFSFYHISCSAPNKKKEYSIETPIGYAWLPIYPIKGKLSLEEQTIAVASHLPPGYLSYKPLGLEKGFSGPEIKWVDGKKELFKVAFKLVSSLFPSDPSLHGFFVHVDKMLDGNGFYPNEDNGKDQETMSTSSSGSQRLSGGSDAGKEISKFVQIQHGMPKLLKCLQDADISDLIRFFPVLMTQLLRLLITTTSEDVSQSIVRVIIHILQRIHDINKEYIVQSYVEYVFSSESLSPQSCKSTLHEELIRSLVSLLRSSNVEFLLMNNLLAHCWFFFRITIKSMVNHLLASNRIKMHRHERFPKEYQEHLFTLIDLFMPQIMQKYRALPGETKLANQSLAYFLQRCFAIMDRGFIFKLIKLYLDKFHTARDSLSLHHYKFEFLSIISAYEHHVPLNLPVEFSKQGWWKLFDTSTKEFGGVDDPMAISEDFIKTHFINGVLIQEVRGALSEVHQVREMAITVFRNLLVKHSFDDRYPNKAQQARIAALYFPFISIILENSNRMCSNGFSSVFLPLVTPTKQSSLASSSKSSTLTSISSKRVSFMDGSLINQSNSIENISKPRKNSAPETGNHVNRESSYLQLIAGTAPLSTLGITVTVPNGNAPNSSDEHDSVELTLKSSSPDPDSGTNVDSRSTSPSEMSSHHRSQSLPVRFDKLNSKEVRDLLIIFLWITKHVPEETLNSWFEQTSDTDVTQFLSLLGMCLHEFKYSGKRLVRRKSAEKSNTLPARISSDALKAVSGVSHEKHVDEVEAVPDMFSNLLEANLATEVGLITLDVLGLVTCNLKLRISENSGDNSIMKKIFEIYLSFLQLGQSETLLRHIFASLRNFVNKYPAVLFRGNPNNVGQLCMELLRCCSSRLTTIRNESSALLYLLMRANFNFSGNSSMTRMHLQVIISISKLLGDSNIDLLNNTRFHESLALIKHYAKSDKSMQGTKFHLLVSELTKKVNSVLNSTHAMRKYENDPEMLLDLQHHLANSYAETSPALRRTWLESMAKNHIKHGNLSEAAHCFAHIAALEAEFLRSTSRLDIPGCKAFQRISANIPRDEELSSLPRKVDDTYGNEEQFSEEMLISSLEQAVDLFTRAERYEVVPEVYKIMIPLHEKTKNYEVLSRIHKSIAESYDKVIMVKKSGRRLLGKYYRVVFFGKEFFEEDSGKEYIYKEPKVTSLPEISQRLKDLFVKRFGASKVKLIMSEKEIDEKKDIDPRFAYIQITHVVPYNDRDEFEKVNNINKFMFETPFSLSDPSKTHSTSCEDQCKRRTILTTSYTFPYVVKRIPVFGKYTETLSPIDVAINEMEARIEELAEVAYSDIKDLKKLQLKLQGSISVQVNAGPLAYAKAFLNANSHKYPVNSVQRLKQLYKDFLSVCEVALDANEKLIASDQHQYHQALKTNFEELVQNLNHCLYTKETNGTTESEFANDVAFKNLNNQATQNSLKTASVNIFDYISGSSNA